MDNHSGEEDAGPDGLFTQEGKPIRFQLDVTIQSKQKRKDLRRRIQEYGGVVVAATSITDVLLVNLPSEERNLRQVAMDCHPDRHYQRVWVEPLQWVGLAIKNGIVEHRRPKEGMGGYIGRRRIAYTSDDDYHLAHYLSRRVPSKEQGGRLGDNLYKDLCSLATRASGEEREEYRWAKRHTWQSWRNRYKSHRQKFDNMIGNIVEMDPPEEARTYNRDRRLGAGSNRRGAKMSFKEESEESGEEQQPKQKRRKVELESESEVEIVESKGKEKEVILSDDKDGEEEDDEMHEEGPAPLYESHAPEEPGPSGMLRDGSIPRSDPIDILPSSFPDASQVTLVATTARAGPSWPPVRGRRSEPMPLKSNFANISASRKVQTAAPTPRMTRASKSPSPILSPAYSPGPSRHPQEDGDYIEGDVFEPSPPPSPPRIDVETLPPAPSTPPRPPSPAYRSPPPRKRKRDRKPPRALIEGPYRNTRSRSRSVEPTAAPAARQARRTRKDVSVSHKEGDLETLPEDTQVENVPRSPADSTVPVSVPVTETFGDEQDVEDLLIGQISTGIGDSHVEDGAGDNATEPQDEEQVEIEQIQGDQHEDEEYVEEAEAEEEEEEEENAIFPPSPEPSPPRRLSSDDREVGDFLRTRFRSSPDIPEMDPDEALAEFRQQLMNTSRPVSGSSMTGRSSRVGPGNVSSGQQVPMMGPPAALPRLAQTPRLSLTRERRDSVSSVETFPLSGTRASEIKLQLEDVERRSPYKPPPGTRAAKVSREGKGRRKQR